MKFKHLKPDGLPAFFAFIKLMIHLLANAIGGYGIFRDELYYYACAMRPELGYVDQPPLSVWMLKATDLLFGHSVFVMRIWPALAGAATVYVVGRIVRKLNGGVFAVSIASLAVILSMINLAFSSIYNMNAFDQLIWALVILVYVRIMQNGMRRDWLFIGVLLGIGMLNKVSVLWLGIGLSVSLLFTPQRKWFITPWPFISFVLSFVIFLPYIYWNATHDWAHIEFATNAVNNKYNGITRMDFLTGQAIINNPFNIPIWLGGLIFFITSGRRHEYRNLFLIFIVTLFILLINSHSKSEYLASSFVLLYIGGGLFFERISRQNLWMRPALYGTVILGIVLLPMVLPVFSPETFIVYQRRMGMQVESGEGKELSQLPQFYADRFGWEQKASEMAKVYHALDEFDKQKCAILGSNYGRSGCIDYYRYKYDLPESIGIHNSYWLWGYNGYDGNLMLILDDDDESLKKYFDVVEDKGIITNEYCMPYENSLHIYLCRELKMPIDQFWKEVKNYN